MIKTAKNTEKSLTVVRTYTMRKHREVTDCGSHLYNEKTQRSHWLWFAPIQWEKTQRSHWLWFAPIQWENTEKSLTVVRTYTMRKQGEVTDCGSHLYNEKTQRSHWLWFAPIQWENTEKSLTVVRTYTMRKQLWDLNVGLLLIWNFLHLSSSRDFRNRFLVNWETFVLNLHISHLLILYVITFSVIVLFLMPTSSSPSWLQFGNSAILQLLACNNCHIHANCDSVCIYLNNILIWLCCF